jgi:hypothetical protein
VPPGIASNRDRGEEGSASLELVGVLPFLLLAILVAAQLGIAGASLWSAGVAARAGARASLVGGSATVVARRSLPPGLRDGARVATGGDGVAVEVPIPRLVPGLPPFGLTVKTRLGPGG